MKCPLLRITQPEKAFEKQRPPDDCLEEECAWWGLYELSEDKEIYCCAIVAIALGLTDIMRKMPTL